MVELLTEGDRLNGHIKGFQENGSHFNFPHNDCAIIDFRLETKKVLAKCLNSSDKLWVALIKEDLKGATLKRKGKPDLLRMM
jgi:hypothetical protein